MSTWVYCTECGDATNAASWFLSRPADRYCPDCFGRLEGWRF